MDYILEDFKTGKKLYITKEQKELLDTLADIEYSPVDTTQEELDDLYKIFASIGGLRDVISSGEHSERFNIVKMLNELCILKADIEKLKANVNVNE